VQRPNYAPLFYGGFLQNALTITGSARKKLERTVHTAAATGKMG